MSGLFQRPYTPLSQTLELTKLVQSVDAFSSDVYGLTSAPSFFGAQAQNLTQRVRILENKVREWDNKIFLFHDVIPDTVLDKFRTETQNLTAATQAIHEYFNLTIRTNQEGNVSLGKSGISSTPPPCDIPRNSPDLEHLRMWSCSTSSSNSSLIDSPSSHPSLSSPGIGSPLPSGTSSPHIASTLPSDWGLSGVEYVRVSSSGSQHWVRINRNSEWDLTSDPHSVSFQLEE